MINCRSSVRNAELWARTTKNLNCRTGPFARPFARSLAPLIRSLAHFAHSLARGKVNDWMSQNDLVLSYSAVASPPRGT